MSHKLIIHSLKVVVALANDDGDMFMARCFFEYDGQKQLLIGIGDTEMSSVQHLAYRMGDRMNVMDEELYGVLRLIAFPLEIVALQPVLNDGDGDVPW